MVLRIEPTAARRHDSPVTPAVIDQRLGFRAIEIDHFAEEDGMVAALVFEPRAATEARGAAFDQRRAFGAVGNRETTELVLSAACEPVRHVLLVRREDMHRPAFRIAKRGQAVAVEREAPQYHRRIEGDRIEAVGGQAHGFARRIARGDDRNPGHETAERVAECGLVQHRTLANLAAMEEQPPHDCTPVIVGVGQFSERPQDAGYHALSYMDLAGEALKAALADAGATGDLAGAIDTIGAIRQFEISRPDATPPFGRADNPPRAIGKRAGADPHRAILETTGGQTPQTLVGELASEIAAGRSEAAAIVGAEAISTVRALTDAGEARDWSEHVGGELEDRGFGLDGMFDAELLQHGATSAIAHYALFENARRDRLGLSLADCRQAMGELFAPFTRIAAANPFAASREVRSADELATVTERNRIVAEPYPRMTVSRDQVNQAAALVLVSAGKARELGIPEERWVHIHAVAGATELPVMERPDLSRSPASLASIEAALARAGRTLDEVRFLDLYSCFAVPVFNVTDHYGLASDDPRGLTLTGGLPFFGGAGNNYSTHAIAEAVARVRAHRGSYALVGANGGFMSKYATGVYSTEPADWSGLDRWQTVEGPSERATKAREPSDALTVETYTVAESRHGPVGIVLGHSDAGEHVAANTDLADDATRALFEGGEPFGARLVLSRSDDGRSLARVGGD